MAEDDANRSPQDLAPAPGPMAPYLIEDGFLSGAELAELLDWSLANEARFKDARIGDGRIDPRARIALTLRDLGPLAELFRERISAAVPGMIAGLRVTPFEISDIELQLAAHNDGAHFAFHADTYVGAPRSERGDRVLSGVYYFHREPKAFSGGDLTLHRFLANQGDAGIDIEPAQNRLVAFPSWAAHEVRPVSVPSRAFADSRFAVNCWIYRARSG
jgi:Rps23 Pro-64 3,4-dihydroxylase Tpa1-like proline 4-hydroxylase